MARKTINDLKPKQLSMDDIRKAEQRASNKSWAALGADTSMTALSVVGIGFDATLGKMVGPAYAEIRWVPDDDYFKRLGEAARGHELVMDVLKDLWVIKPENVYLAIEEPFHYGAAQRQIAGWLKQQAEISGSFKGSLVRYGYQNIYEINNSQWHKTLRDEGVEFIKMVKALTKPERREAAHRNKFIVKEWAVRAFGLPDLPDLVKSKSGAKIVRPESGFGAKAKAEQPNDIYDAAACCAWMADEMERLGIIEN